MSNTTSTNIRRLARARKTKAKIIGTSLRPRLRVFRSLRNISAALIDDTVGKTLFSITDKKFEGKRLLRAKQVGTAIANAAKEKKISLVVFDRAGYQYHGRVAALAAGAREAGLKF